MAHCAQGVWRLDVEDDRYRLARKACKREQNIFVVPVGEIGVLFAETFHETVEMFVDKIFYFGQSLVGSESGD